MDSIYLFPMALLLMRLWLGLTLVIQAADKLFVIGIENTSQAVEFNISKFKLSPKNYRIFIGLTSWLEFIGGTLLILGLFTPIAYAFVGFDMLLISVAFSLNTPMWDMRHFFPRFLILILLLLFSFNNDIFSLDHLLLN